MKIAIFEPYIEGKGGAQKVISQYSNYLKKKGHKIEIFTQRYNPKNSYSGFKNIKINCIKPSSKSLSFLAFLKKFSGYDMYISNDWPSNFISIRNKPSAWVCYSPKRDFYDLKEYYWSQASLIQKINLFMKRVLFKGIDKLSAKKTTLICPISKTIEKRVKNYYGLTSHHLFYCGINFKDYKQGKYEDYFLYVSRLVKPKRVDLAVKAMNLVKNKKVKLYVVGSGPEESDLKRIAKGNKNVKFLGALDDTKLQKLYSNSLGIIFTPVREDWGLIPIEAAASGKMTIGVDEGGLRETIIEGKTGFLIKNITPEKIAEKIDKIANNPKLAKKMGKAAKKYCMQFDWKNIFPQFENKLIQIAKKYKVSK